MGHLTALGSSVDEALEKARAAVATLGWADDTADEEQPVAVATEEGR